MALTIDVNALFGPLPAASSDLSVDDLAHLMQKHAIHRTCVISTVGMLLDYTMGNAATRAACSESAALAPVATVNPLSYYGGEGPARQFVEEGFRLVRFFPKAQGWPIDYAPFRTLVRTLTDAGLPIMVDLTDPGDATRLVDELNDVPGTIILAGIGERQLSEVVALMRARPSLYVETSGLTATGALKLVVAAVGAGRVLFGSGAPTHPLAGAIAAVRHAGLSEADSERVMGETARDLLKL